MRTEDGFRVAAGAPEEMGAATSAVADGVRALGVGRPLQLAASALPGSTFAGAAERVVAGWSAHGHAIADDLAAQAQALTGAGHTYASAEAAAVDTLRRTQREV